MSTIHPHLTKRAILLALVFFAFLCSSHSAPAQYFQEKPKLIGTGAADDTRGGSSVALSSVGNTALVGGTNANEAWVFTSNNGLWNQQAMLAGNGASGSAEQGYAVALSADGNTAIVGGPGDNGGVGAAWVFTQSGGVWTQQGSKLIPTGGSGSFGYSVALSADGNTAMVGGPGDSNGAGAAFVFTRSGGVWTQQGSKLVGTGAVNPYGSSTQGAAVAISADGNTAIVGGPGDDQAGFKSLPIGAFWVFTRSGGVWTQQGPKQVPPGTETGASVALSADGNTALIGGPGTGCVYVCIYPQPGAAWVYTRSGGVWTQQGPALVGSGAVNNAEQGSSVALSGDGNTAIVGGPADNGGVGAGWVFTRSGGVWTQQTKLIGTGVVGNAAQGSAVALSGDGNTAVLGGPQDNASTGAAWVFGPHNLADTHDFNGDGFSDIAWRATDGTLAMWLMNGTQILQGATLGPVGTNWAVVGQRDFNGDGYSDLLWRASDGTVAIWLMNGTQILQGAAVGVVSTNWTVVGTGDFNGDGKGDIAWMDNAGNVAIWLMNGTQIVQGAVTGQASANWTIAGTGDFNGDGKTDLLWRDNTGNVAIWLMNGTQILQGAVVGQVGLNWTIVGTGDFNGDGYYDLLWRDNVGNVAIWLMNGFQILQGAALGQVGTNWAIQMTGDYNGDGKSDLLWRATDGTVAMWLMNGTQILQGASLGVVATNWAVQTLNAD